MRKYSKFIVAAGAVAALAVPSVAMADAPNGTYTIDQKANANASLVGQDSSQITQNGQFVSGKSGDTAGTWQNQAGQGQRAAQVQALLGHTS